MKCLLIICLVLMMSGCSAAPVSKVDDVAVTPREYSEKELDKLFKAKYKVSWDLQAYCGSESEENHSFLNGVCEPLDYENGTNYYVSDSIDIYYIDEMTLEYTKKENVMFFLNMREDQVYSHYMVYPGGGKTASDGVELLSEVFNAKENFVMVSTYRDVWIITEDEVLLFEPSNPQEAFIEESTVEFVREIILNHQTASFYKHQIDVEALEEEMDQYVKKQEELERSFQFPSGDVLLKDLFQEDIYEMNFTIYAMEGNTYIRIYEQKMKEILAELGNLEITTDFKKQHGAGGERIEMRLDSDNGWSLTYTEDTNEMTLKAEKNGKKMTYALKDSELREEGILLPVVKTMLEGSYKVLNNGRFDIPLIPANVAKEGCYLSGEPGLYSYPYESVQGIDFSGITVYCDGELVDEISTEPGLHLLNLFFGKDEYVLQYSVD